MQLKFVTDEAALLAGKALIIADLHLGIEKEFYDSGIRLPSQVNKIKARIEKLIENTEAKKLIFLGDVKHKVPGISWQEQREVPEFLNYFNRKIDTELVLGNHDTDLKGLIPNIKLHKKGLMLEGVYLTHGHLWPDAGFLEAGYVVVGHTHPLLEITDRLGYSWRFPAWIKAGLVRKKILEKYSPGKRLPELVIMPSFNEFSGGVRMNSSKLFRERFGPLVRSSNLKKGKVYLLDGTYLGELGRL